MTEEKIILYDDPNSIKWVTDIEGWVDRHGHFWGIDERQARYSSYTHRKCSCGNVYRRNSYCMPCQKRKELEKYQAMPRKKWDGTGMLYPDRFDRWFSEWDEVFDFAELEPCSIADMRLIICEPVYPGYIDGTDYYRDDLPEDTELRDMDPELAKLIDAVNEHISLKKTPISWRPGKFAVEVEEWA